MTFVLLFHNLYTYHIFKSHYRPHCLVTRWWSENVHYSYKYALHLDIRYLSRAVLPTTLF